jgi:predicted ArsR family transcriptional regulator
MREPDLFSYADLYPAAPGAKVEGTSRDAADAMAGRAANLREACRRALLEAGPMSADECAELLAESVLAVRPRFSELRTLGLIDDTGWRRANRSGRNAVVWRAIT